jgi:hypothetical protein
MGMNDNERTSMDRCQWTNIDGQTSVDRHQWTEGAKWMEPNGRTLTNIGWKLTTMNDNVDETTTNGDYNEQ